MGRFVKGFKSPIRQKKIILICKECGKKYKRLANRVIGSRFCSRSCCALWVYKHRNYKSFNRLRVKDNNPFWKGGRWKNNYGYILVYKPGHPYYNHQKGPYVFEHRLVIEQKIGRYLLPKERVHHINGIKDDNRPENLGLFSNQNEHIREHIHRGDIKMDYWRGKKLSAIHRKHMRKPHKK